MSAIIIDTETTDTEAPDVIQLAWAPLLPAFEGSPCSLSAPGGEIAVQRFKPRKPIALGAMATHHIILEDLETEPEWSGKWPLPMGVTFLVGHSIDFDWKAIGEPPVRRICTLALARKLWPALDSHSLSAMTYHLTPHREARELLRGAHDALTDVALCHRLLLAELALMPKIVTWERLWDASERARVPTHFTFGKYGPQKGEPGLLISEVRRMDPGYIDWCINKCDQCKDEYWQRALRGEAA